MFFCQNCGKPLRENAKFCHICGAEQSLNEYEEAPRREDPKEHEPKDPPAPPKVIHLPPVEEPAAPPEKPGDEQHAKPADEKPPEDGQKTFSVKCSSLELDCKFEDGTGTLTIRFR